MNILNVGVLNWTASCMLNY